MLQRLLSLVKGISGAGQASVGGGLGAGVGGALGGGQGRLVIVLGLGIEADLEIKVAQLRPQSGLSLGNRDLSPCS